MIRFIILYYSGRYCMKCRLLLILLNTRFKFKPKYRNNWILNYTSGHISHSTSVLYRLRRQRKRSNESFTFYRCVDLDETATDRVEGAN